MRPRGVRDLRHQAVYLFGAVCPARDAGVALVLPMVSAAAMQAMLDELSQAVPADAHAVVLMDRAGWHIEGSGRRPTCCAAWNALLAETGRIRSLCALDWATTVNS